jgi:hypothetical protein
MEAQNRDVLLREMQQSLTFPVTRDRREQANFILCPPRTPASASALPFLSYFVSG